MKRTSLIYLFFFVSGAPALVYQLAWQRVLFRMFGVNMESVTIVVTAFMLGLGLGSLIGSFLASRRSFPPLLLIAAIEAAVGLFGVSSLALFEAADPLVRDLPLLAQVFAAIGLLFVPTALMGMTLPLVVGHLIARSANVGLSTGSLYRVNTLGAVAGCLVAALLLFPFLGLARSVGIAAATNGAIALSAVLAHFAEGRADDEAAAPLPAPGGATTPFSYGAALALAFAAGFVSLSYEIFLVRLTSFQSQTNALVLTLTLAVFLLGIAAGARAAAVWSAGASSPAALAGRIMNTLALSGLAGLLLLPLLAASAPLGPGVIITLSAAYLIARSLGTVFPLLAHFAVPPDRRSGGRVGLILLFDILGSAAGSLGTGFVLSDVLGARGLAVTLALSTFAVAIPFAAMARMRESRFWQGPAAALGAAAVLIGFQAPFTARLMEAMLYKTQLPHSPPLVRVVENRDGIVAVSADGTVYGGGIYDGRFNTDLVHDTNGIVRPFGLSLYHPHPRDVLMIGLASGSWGQVIANNPEVAHFTIVEINPGYLQVIAERPEVRSLLASPKVHIAIDDGRRWLRRHPGARFDAIMANTTYHFRANATNVLSMEFNDLIRAHLKPGGFYFFNTTSEKRAERTGCMGFRHGYRVINHMLLGDAPFDLDTERWRRNLLATRIDSRPVFDLARPGDAAALAQVLAMPRWAERRAAQPAEEEMESCSSVLARTAGLMPITDDNMGTEWRYPLGMD